VHALETSKRAEVCFDPSPGQPSPGREADHRHDHEGGDEHGVEVQAMHRHTQSNWCALRGDEARSGWQKGTVNKEARRWQCDNAQRG